MSKTYYIGLLLLLSSTLTISQTGWYQQVSGTGYNLNSVFFTDANTGFAAGDSGGTHGLILKTTNGGSNWRKIDSLGTFQYVGLNSVHFIDANTGFVCGWQLGTSSDIVIRTTNAGANWTQIYYQYANYGYSSVRFINISTGMVVGTVCAPNCRCYVNRTTNGGINWNSTVLGNINTNLNSLCFTDAMTGYACGTSTFAKTTNAGANWTLHDMGIELLNSIYFLNNLTGWMCGKNDVYKTTNGGNNWNTSFVQNNCISLYSVWFVNEQTGWVCGCQGAIYGTTNGGTNWLLQSTGTTFALYSMSFASAQTGWAVGANGRILKTTNGGITYVHPISNEIPNNFSLSQNYPNPFNPVTRIRFQIPLLRGVDAEGGRGVSLKVYDIQGKEVQTLLNQQLQPGTYGVEWDASNYPSGVYYYRLNADEYTETKKMVLVK